MYRNKTAGYAATFLGFVLIGLILQLAGMKSGKLVFPGVDTIFRRFCFLIIQPRTWQMIGTTFLHLILSLFISAVCGIITGSLQGLCPLFRNLIRPLLTALRSLPMIVLVIMIMVLNRYETVPVTATVIVLFPMFSEAVSEGIQRIDRELIDVYSVNGSFSLRVFFRVHLPLISGYIRQSYISAAGTGIKVAVTSEYLVQSSNSLGKAVFSSFFFSEYADIYAYAIIMILLILFLTEFPEAVLRQINRKKEITMP